MEFVCIQQCFDGKLWEIGEKRNSDIDLSVSDKKKESISWRRVNTGTYSAETGDKKTHRELQVMEPHELILYTYSRFRGTKLESSMTKIAMLKEIATLEKAKEKQDRTGIV